jgi:lipoprotein-anchoring transpeptidase ErfK/SrfK
MSETGSQDKKRDDTNDAASKTQASHGKQADVAKQDTRDVDDAKTIHGEQSHGRDEDKHSVVVSQADDAVHKPHEPKNGTSTMRHDGRKRDASDPLDVGDTAAFRRHAPRVDAIPTFLQGYEGDGNGGSNVVTPPIPATERVEHAVAVSGNGGNGGMRPPTSRNGHMHGNGCSDKGTDTGSGKRRGIVIGIVAAVIAILCVIYGYGVTRYQSRLFPNTTVGGVDVSNMTASEADKALDTSGWKLTIDDITGQDVTIGPKEAGLSVNMVKPSKLIREQNAFAWPFHVFGNASQSISRKTSFDTKKLESTLSSLDMVNADKRTKAVDATYRYDQSQRKWYVQPDSQGNVVDRDKLIKAVENSLDGLKSPTVKVTQDMCVQPKVTANDKSLNQAVNDANKWCSTSITYDIDDKQSAEVVDSSVITPWVSIVQADDGTFSAKLDESAVKAYLAKIGDKYDTQGQAITITTPTGKVASVPGTEKNTGWLTDESAELPKLEADIKAGKTDHREFSMKQRASQKTGADVWGTTYIEVDLSTQHLWYVKDGSVADDFGIISGKSGYDTPQGVTKVYRKVTNTTLVSPWKDPKTGEPTYKTPIEVGLVISADSNILIHSAPWQPASGFGNATYHISGGSHGCVNAPTDKTWDLYNTVAVNTPVVVHS